MYAIARRLSLAARRETADVFAAVLAANPGTIRLVGARCYCPLGYALEAMGTPAKVAYVGHKEEIVPAPAGWAVVKALGLEDEPGALKAAWAFIDAWDQRRIQDIHTALGVRKPKGDSACSPATPNSTPTPDPAP